MADEQTELFSNRKTCCALAKKIILSPLVLAEQVCGVSDTELADITEFDIQDPSGKPVLAVRFCPWCGKQRSVGKDGFDYGISSINNQE